MLIFVILTVFILSAHWESPRTQGAGEVKVSRARTEPRVGGSRRKGLREGAGKPGSWGQGGHRRGRRE